MPFIGFKHFMSQTSVSDSWFPIVRGPTVTLEQKRHGLNVIHILPLVLCADLTHVDTSYLYCLAET